MCSKNKPDLTTTSLRNVKCQCEFHVIDDITEKKQVFLYGVRCTILCLSAQINGVPAFPQMRETNHTLIQPFYAGLKGSSHPWGHDYSELIHSSMLTDEIKILPLVYIKSTCMLRR